MTPRFALGILVAGTVVVGAATMGERIVARQGNTSRTTVIYWEKWTGKEGEDMRKVVDAFNASQDRILVHYLSISGVDQKTLLATSGGNPPDIAGIWQDQVLQFADNGALMDLSPYARATGVRREQYIPAYWDPLTDRGHLLALPSTPASITLHVRPDLVPAQFASPETFPKTLEGLDALSDQITRRSKNGSLELAGFLPSNPGWWNWAWGPLFGADLLKGGRPTLNSPEMIRAFTWTGSYAKRYGSQAVQTFQSGFGNFSSPQDPFMTGKVATELNGVWKANYINIYRKELKWFAVPFPYPADRPDLAGHSILSQDVLVIPRGAKHPREAFEFIRFVQRQDVMEGLCLSHGKTSPLQSVSEEFFRRHSNPQIRLFDALARSPQAITLPHTGMYPQMGAELGNAFQEVNTGSKTPRQALNDAQRRVDGLWEIYQTQVVNP